MGNGRPVCPRPFHWQPTQAQCHRRRDPADVGVKLAFTAMPDVGDALMARMPFAGPDARATAEARVPSRAPRHRKPRASFVPHRHLSRFLQVWRAGAHCLNLPSREECTQIAKITKPAQSTCAQPRLVSPRPRPAQNLPCLMLASAMLHARQTETRPVAGPSCPASGHSPAANLSEPWQTEVRAPSRRDAQHPAACDLRGRS